MPPLARLEETIPRVIVNIYSTNTYERHEFAGCGARRPPVAGTALRESIISQPQRPAYCDFEPTRHCGTAVYARCVIATRRPLSPERLCVSETRHGPSSEPVRRLEKEPNVRCAREDRFSHHVCEATTESALPLCIRLTTVHPNNRPFGWLGRQAGSLATSYRTPVGVCNGDVGMCTS